MKILVMRSHIHSKNLFVLSIFYTYQINQLILLRHNLNNFYNETIFGFLFDSKKIKALDEDELKKYCINLEIFLRFNEYSDINSLDLFSEL